MLALLAVLLIIWLICGVVGFTVHGLMWLGIAGVALLVLTLAGYGTRRLH